MPIQGNRQETGIIASRSSIENLDNLQLKKTITSASDEFFKSGKISNRDYGYLMDAETNYQGDLRMLQRNTEVLASLGLVNNQVKTENVLKRLREDDNYEKLAQDRFDENYQFLKSHRAAGGSVVAGVQRRQQGRNAGGQGQGSHADIPEEARELLARYKAAYSSAMVSQDPQAKAKAKKEADEIKEKLKHFGISAEDLQSVNLNIRFSAREELARLIKEAFLQKMASPTKTLEWALAEKSLNDILNSAFFNDQLGGWDWGGGVHLNDVTYRAIDSAREQMASTVLNELENELIRDSINPGSASSKRKTDLMKMAQDLGVDIKKWSEVFKQKYVDLGCVGGVPDNLDKDGQNKDGQNKKSKQESDEELEKLQAEQDKQFMLDEYRKVYMERYFKNDLKTMFATARKLRALNHRLKDMGISDMELKALKVQGKKVASLKVIANLKDAYLERIVLLSESGARVKLTNKRINKMIKHLHELGVELTNEEIEKVKEECERQVYNNALSKLMILQSLGEKDATEEVKKDMQHLQKLVTRIEGIWAVNSRIKARKEKKFGLLRSIFNRMTIRRYIDKKA